MEKQVYVQLRGVEKAVQMIGNEAKFSGSRGSNDYVLEIFRQGDVIGAFDGNAVVGWWYLT